MSNAHEFTVRLTTLLRGEQAAMADFLVALAEFDERRLWMELGHASLFAFLHRELELSKASSFYRQTAARLIQRFPEIVAPLRDGRLCLTSIVELSRVLTPENVGDVLPRFFGCSKAEAKVISAELLPAQAVPLRDVVARIAPSCDARAQPQLSARVGTDEVRLDEPTAAAAATPAAAAGLDGATARRVDVPSAAVSDHAHAPLAAAGPDRDLVEPLTADLRRLHLTVSRRLLAKLEDARLALSHARPGASTSDVLEAALDLMLAQHAKRRACVEKPRKALADVVPAATASARIPAPVAREVWQRSGGCCEWPVESGGVCGSRLRLELDHVAPRARGGPSTVANLRVLCRVHNQLAARQTLGDDVMERHARRGGVSARAAAC